jgi:hypothetical protein
MWCVIDMQGYGNTEKKFIPKEVVLCAENAFEKFIISPQKNLWEYVQKDRALISWATNKYHNIPYNYGETTLEEFNYLIHFAALKYERIYAKGREKTTYLTHLLARPIFDLSESACPTIRRDVGPPCRIHTKETAHCAEANAKFMQLWIATHLERPS